MVNRRVQNALLGCNLKNDRMISVCFQGKPFNITVIQVYALTSNAEEIERFYGWHHWLDGCKSEWNSPIPVHFSSLIPRMSMFTLVISCLTTFNLPWFMDLTFQVPMQYCCLQHWTLLPSPVTSTTGCCFCFGSISSFFLELFLHWSPVAYLTECGPLEKGMASHFSILALRTPWTVWKGKMIGYWKRNSPGH